MASQTGGTENAVTPLTDEGVSPVKQNMEDIEGRLVTLSDKLNLCNRVLNDLKDLSGVLARRSLQDESLPLQK